MDIIAVKIGGCRGGSAAELDKLAREEQLLRERVLPKFSPARQGKVDAYRQADDRVRSMAGELLVRVYAAERWALLELEQLRGSNSYGKPYLYGRPDCQYNVSHSGRWVAAVFGSTPVGIDVERIHTVNLAIADRFFSRPEAEYLRAQPLNRQLECFFELWTLKESYIKAVGAGMSIPLDSFSFTLHEDGDIELLADPGSAALGNWQFKQYNVDPGYKLAVCSTELNYPGSIQIWTLEELLGRFEQIGG
ncbi:4'-phosphopantetheinyl transferase family protein [Paenibacillus tarimensis]|uniref:4'-phosphopantetheinyl transferase family protein n=1 Tax=Paenibacillus tarimensis TaxID=416012 RepID=UPI001F3ECC9B|nr:4'-phosphopantetheinyl transferase superfamily protein [Paenibacillus tarimensis]MCF2945790.1 4'-phosphopantetheinyl transferase superfamily protein [Paenibacillus tarimensis]